MLSTWVEGYLAAINDCISKGYPKHAGERESHASRRPVQGTRRTGTSSAVLFHTKQPGLAPVLCTSMKWDRPGEGKIFRTSKARTHSQGLASHELYCCHFFWGESCPSVSWLFSTQRLVWILYALHLPFPSDLRVDFFFSPKCRCFKSNVLVHL